MLAKQQTGRRCHWTGCNGTQISRQGFLSQGFKELDYEEICPGIGSAVERDLDDTGAESAQLRT
jgi:hypothetical protein